MRAQFKKFSGGYEFHNFAGRPSDEVVDLGIPEQIIIPLKQGFGEEVPPNVKVGDKVRAGQIIGIDNDSVSNPVHSSVNGVIDKISKIKHVKQEVSAVKIRSDGTSDWEKLETQTDEWEELPEEKIEEILYLSGAASLDKGGIPTRYKSSAILPDDVRHIIVQGVESELFSPSLGALLGGDNAYHFVEGLKILRKILPKAKLHLAINGYQRIVIKRLFNLIDEYNWIEPILLMPKYPQEYEEVIVPTILGMKIPYGTSPARLGVVVLSIQTILHIYEAVVVGKPVIERIVALGGTGFRDNYHARVRVGTTIEHLTKGRMDGESRLVLNSPLTGATLSDPDFPIDRQCESIIALPEKTNREFLAFVRPGFRRDGYSRTFLSRIPMVKKTSDTNIHGEERPCISCTFCEEVCPVRIIPHLLYKYAKKSVINESLVNLEITKCIDCNLCNYVCPSKIPIAQYIKEGKEKLVQEGYIAANSNQ